jgi:hypothetical protein
VADDPLEVPPLTSADRALYGKVIPRMSTLADFAGVISQNVWSAAGLRCSICLPNSDQVASACQCLRCRRSLPERIGLEEQCKIPMQGAMAEFEKLAELRSGDPSVLRL